MPPCVLSCAAAAFTVVNQRQILTVAAAADGNSRLTNQSVSFISVLLHFIHLPHTLTKWGNFAARENKDSVVEF